MIYKLRYQAASYSGIETVYADSESEAIERVEQQIRREMTLPSYHLSVKVIDVQEEKE